MPTQEVVVEKVEWNRNDIEHATRRVISFFALELADLGASRWCRFTLGIVASVRGERAVDAELEADGFSLIFMGPKPTLNPVYRDGHVIWTEKEPRIVLIDNSYANLTPRSRNLLYHTSEDIAEEVRDTYKLAILHDPLSFIFTKEQYAKVEINRAALFSLN